MKRAFQIVSTFLLILGVASAQEVAPLPKKIEVPSVPLVPKVPLPTFIKQTKDEVPKVPSSLNGPGKAKPNQTVFLDFSGDLGVDPKFDVVPKPETFRVLKDFNGKLVILITPGEALSGKTILIVYADTKNNKTILATYSLEVTGDIKPPDVPPGPDPKPTPIKLKYFDDLKAAYLVSPDPASLDILINIYTEIGTSQFAKRSDAATVLRNICAKKLVDKQGKPDPTILRKVRDTVHTLLDSDVGTSDSAPFDLTIYKQFWTDITTSLTAIKAGK